MDLALLKMKGMKGLKAGTIICAILLIFAMIVKIDIHSVPISLRINNTVQSFLIKVALL